MPEEMTPREAELAAAVARLEAENKLLREKTDLLIKRLFGAKSERVDAAQLLLLLRGVDEPGKSPEPVAPEGPRRSKEASPPSCRRKSPRIPEDLPLIEEVIEPEPVKAAPEAWRRIGEEVSERLDYEPARFLRRRTVRPKYVKRGEVDTVPVVAPLPPAILERSIVGPGMLAQVIVAKYCDHLPLHRQESIYWSRHNVWLPRQTLCEWVELGAGWLRLIYNEIKNSVFAREYVQVDETPLRYLDPGNGKTRLGYLWVCGRPGSDALFHWEPSRAAAVLEKIIPEDFIGTTQCDGYEAYDCFARRRGERIVLAGCMAHVRRKFYEAQDQSPRVAAWILRQFQALYAVESSLKESGAGPRLRGGGACVDKPHDPATTAPGPGALEGEAPVHAREPDGARDRLRAQPMGWASGLPRQWAARH